MQKHLKFLFLLFLIIVFCVSPAFAQLTIQGKVQDNAGNILIGASVLVTGTQIGSLSDMNGEYKIEVKSLPEGKNVLEARYIGYKTQRKTISKISGLEIINFSLENDILNLNQVVVTGTADAVEKKSLGNTITSIPLKDIENNISLQVDALLSGKIPGALIQVNSGNPGGGTSVRLRGISTLYSGTSDPLYIIDGVILDNSANYLIDLGGNSSNRLADLEPEDIDRIEVVKGAAAAALYGSRANNGVVQIFTKRGSPGEMKVKIGLSGGYDQIVKKMDVLMYPYTLDASGKNLLPVKRYNYQDEIFHIAPRFTTNISLSGGDQFTKYFFSGTWNDQAGIIRSTKYDRQSIRLNLDRVVTNWLNISLSTNYIHSLNNVVPNGGVDVNGFGVLTGFTQIQNTANCFADENGVYPLAAWSSSNRANPLDVINNWRAPEEINRYILGMRFDVALLTGLSIQYKFGYDNYTQNTGYFIPRVSSQTKYPKGFSQEVNKSSFLVNSDLDVIYNYDLFPDLHTTTAIGTNYQHSQYDLVNSSAQDLVPFVKLLTGSASLDAVDEYKDIRRTLGFYFQETFKIYNTLYLTGSIRMDGSSTFGKDQRWQTFPKFSASYLLSENDFWRDNVSFIFNSFKLRAALGYSGGQPVASFGRLSNYTQTTYDGKLGILNSSLFGNDGLKPERMREYEIGTDFEILEGRIGMEFTYFNKKVEDLIIEQIVNPSTGFIRQLQNVGILSNKGIELLIRSLNFNLPDFNWITTFSFSTNNPIIDKLYGNNVRLSLSWSQTILEAGKAPTTFYAKTINYSKIDANGLPVRDETLKYLGDPNPKYIWSLTNEFKILNDLSIRVQLDALWDFKILDWNTRSAKHANWQWHPDYEKEFTGQLPKGYNNRIAGALGEFVTDASFAKLRELSISYTLRNEFIRYLGINNLQLNLIGRNLFTFTKYPSWDPEVNAAGQDVLLRGWDWAVTPNPRSIVFGVNINL